MFAGGDERAAVLEAQQKRWFVYLVDGFDDCGSKLTTVAATDDLWHFIDGNDAITDGDFAKRNPV